jgi:hypothetical protein
LNAEGYDEWFASRGMGSCNWLALMWTHTTLDNMSLECPIKTLPTNPASSGDVHMFDKYNNKESLYFEPGDKLDYWSHFLSRGAHSPSPYEKMSGEEDSGCDWIVDGVEVHWPLTRIDCVIALDVLKRKKLENLASIVREVTDFTKTQATNALFCSL